MPSDPDTIGFVVLAHTPQMHPGDWRILSRLPQLFDHRRDAERACDEANAASRDIEWRVAVVAWSVGGA